MIISLIMCCSFFLIGWFFYKKKKNPSRLNDDQFVQSSSSRPTVNQVHNSSMPNSEVIWNFLMGEIQLQEAEKYLFKQRETYLLIAKDRTHSEKKDVLSRLEFDRVKGITFLRKQTEEEKNMTIALLEYEATKPCDNLRNLHGAFYPNKPAFFMLDGRIEFPEHEWQKRGWMSLVQRGYAKSGENIPIESLLELLSLKELAVICERFQVQPAKRKKTMIDGLLEKSIVFNQIKDFYRSEPYVYMSPVPSERSAIEHRWEVCSKYVELSRQIKGN